MERRTRDAAIAVAIVFVIVCLAGQAIVYDHNPYRCDVSVERTEQGVAVSVDTNYALEYTAVSLTSVSLAGVSSYAVWYDDAYPVAGDRDAILDCIERLQLYFANDRSELRTIGTDELKETVGSRDVSVALLFITGTLPAEVYSGSPDDPLFGWLAAGGAMYWLNGKIGHSYAEYASSETIPVEGSDILFFGADDVVNPSTGDVYTRNIEEGTLTDIVGIYYGETTNGIDCSRLRTAHLALDCNDGTYSAVVFVQYHGGSGTIGVFGGHVKHEDVPTSVMSSVAQAVVSRISYDTVLDDSASRSGSATVELSCAPASHVFVYFGQMNTVWGKCFLLRSASDGAAYGYMDTVFR